jgi:hypothetical protein
MGCCFTPSLTSGEDYIRRIIHSLNIWDTSYRELKSQLINNSLDELIEKQTVKDVILKSYAETEEQKVVLDLILSKLQNKSSIYWVLYYMFPFLSFSETSYLNFYEVILNLNKNQPSLEDILKYLKYYYEFVLISITEELKNYLSKNKEITGDKSEIISDIDFHLQKVYNISNIENELEHIENMINQVKEQEMEKKFQTVCEVYNGLNFYYKDVRDFYNYKFGKL